MESERRTSPQLQLCHPEKREPEANTVLVAEAGGGAVGVAVGAVVEVEPEVEDPVEEEEDPFK